MVEAATNWPETARFMRGFPAESLESASQSSWEMPPTNSSGLKLGALAMASTSPLVTSSATTAPEMAPLSTRCARSRPEASAASAACWMERSMVSTTSDPLSAGTDVE